MLPWSERGQTVLNTYKTEKNLKLWNYWFVSNYLCIVSMRLDIKTFKCLVLQTLLYIIFCFVKLWTTYEKWKWKLSKYLWHKLQFTGKHYLELLDSLSDYYCHSILDFRWYFPFQDHNLHIQEFLPDIKFNCMCCSSLFNILHVVKIMHRLAKK